MRFLRLIPLSVWALLLGEFVLIFSVYLLVAALMSPIDAWVWVLHGGGASRLLVLVTSVLFGLYVMDLYTTVMVESFTRLLQQMSMVFGLVFLSQALLSYLAPNWLLPRWIMMVGSLVTIAVLPAWRWQFSRTIQSNQPDERILFVGTNDLVVVLAREFQSRPELDKDVIGYVEDVPETVLEGVPRRGHLRQMGEIINDLKPGRIVIGLRGRAEELPIAELLELGSRGFRIEDAESTFEQVHGRVSLKHIRPQQFIYTRNVGPQPAMLHLQTAYSFALAALALIVVVPVMIIVAILVKLTSRGPIFYRQTRVGAHGRHFSILKFRSMREDAEKISGAAWATKNDPRLTSIGKWLRKLRIDELPQLANVLAGDMVLVGPRPERPEFVGRLSEEIPLFRQRLVVKPGITGWAQINHRYGDTIEDAATKLEYDLYYIKYLTVAFDFYIMFHTVKIMLLARGAQ